MCLCRVCVTEEGLMSKQSQYFYLISLISGAGDAGVCVVCYLKSPVSSLRHVA